MASDAKARLKEIIDSYLERDGGASIDTGIVASHLAQMKLFCKQELLDLLENQQHVHQKVLKIMLFQCLEQS